MILLALLNINVSSNIIAIIFSYSEKKYRQTTNFKFQILNLVEICNINRNLYFFINLIIIKNIVLGN